MRKSSGIKSMLENYSYQHAKDKGLLPKVTRSLQELDKTLRGVETPNKKTKK